MSKENLEFIYTIYNNVLEFLKRNNYKTASKLSEDEFLSEYTKSANKKIRIEAVKDFKMNDSENKTENKTEINLSVIILTESDSAFKTSADMETLIKSINEKNNVLIITPDDVSAGIQKRIDSFNETRPGKILNYHNKKFTMVFPDRERAAKHRIVGKEEEQIILKDDLMAKAANIGQIIVTGPTADVQAVWIEAKPGDLIHIREKVETAAYMDSYRRAV